MHQCSVHRCTLLWYSPEISAFTCTNWGKKKICASVIQSNTLNLNWAFSCAPASSAPCNTPLNRARLLSAWEHSRSLMFVCVSELCKDPTLFSTCANTKRRLEEVSLSSPVCPQALHGVSHSTLIYLTKLKLKSVLGHIMQLLCYLKSK